jgi:hypothetical protein
VKNGTHKVYSLKKLIVFIPLPIDIFQCYMINFAEKKINSKIYHSKQVFPSHLPRHKKIITLTIILIRLIKVIFIRKKKVEILLIVLRIPKMKFYLINELKYMKLKTLKNT